MFQESRDNYSSDTATVNRVAELLGVGSGAAVLRWVRQTQVDAGQRPGVTSEESVELKRLKRENAELRRANAILKAASAFFAAELDRPGL
jgi:transposase